MASIDMRGINRDCEAFKGALAAWSGSTRFSIVAESEELDP